MSFNDIYFKDSLHTCSQSKGDNFVKGTKLLMINFKYFSTSCNNNKCTSKTCMHSELHVANIFCSYMYIKDLHLIINFSIDQYQSMQQKWISESMKTSTSNATFTLELIKMAVFRTSCKSSNAIQLMLLACLSSFLILKSQTKRKLQWIQFFQTHRSCSRINIHVYKYPSCSLISCRR